MTPSGATGLQVVDGLSELATTGVPGTIVQVGKDLSMAVDPDRACRLDQDAVRPSRVQALVVATVDQWAAAVGATDPAAGTAGLARMSLAGSSGSWPGASLDPATLARLMCDAGLRRVLLAGDGRVLNVGCTTRLATPAQRKALAVRDVGCIIPGCGMPTEWSDVHHVVPWSAGGATDGQSGGPLPAPPHRPSRRDLADRDARRNSLGQAPGLARPGSTGTAA